MFFQKGTETRIGSILEVRAQLAENIALKAGRPTQKVEVTTNVQVVELASFTVASLRATGSHLRSSLLGKMEARLKLIRAMVSATVLIVGIQLISPNLPASVAMLVRRGHETLNESLARLDQSVAMGLQDEGFAGIGH